jgi:flagellar biosynthesis protein
MKDHKKAVALKYDKKISDTPTVLAKGRGFIADQIVSIAKKNGVAIYPDRDLVTALEALDLNIEIPEELYRAVAEVLVFIYDMNKKLA